jgi:hypothetical protein
MIFVYLLVWWSFNEWNPNGGDIKTDIYSEVRSCIVAKDYIEKRCLAEDKICTVVCLKKPIRETP